MYNHYIIAILIVELAILQVPSHEAMRISMISLVTLNNLAMCSANIIALLKKVIDYNIVHIVWQ